MKFNPEWPRYEKRQDAPEGCLGPVVMALRSGYEILYYKYGHGTSESKWLGNSVYGVVIEKVKTLYREKGKDPDIELFCLPYILGGE